MSLRSIHIEGGTLIWDDGAIGIMLRGTNGEVGQDIQRRAYAVQKRMKRLAGKWSGELIRGIHVESIVNAPDGPASRIVSDAPHTIVHEVGRGRVTASGLTSPSQRPTRSSRQASKSSLRWGSDPGSTLPTALTIRLTPGGGFYFATSAGPAAGSKFMENSIDAALE